MTDGKKIHSYELERGAAGSSQSDPVAARAPSLTAVCGSFPIRIARDGTWYHEGSPIGRKPLVKLFASVLRRDDQGKFWLVTPVERGTIEVEDAPFVAVLCDVEGVGDARRLVFTTNLDERVAADPAHPIRVDGSEDSPRPYVTVRDGLEARIARAVYYQLVDLAEANDADMLGVRSCGAFFPIGGGTGARR
jgi:hypothetical protein